MNAQPNPAFQSPAASPAVTAIRPMYWSIRREVWENRSIYIAPLAAAAVVMCGWLISLFGLPRSVREIAALDPPHQSAALAQPYSHAAFLIILTGFIVGIFYSLDALYGERRDRSILFWKSLPISDARTVLSKAIIPLAVLPLLSFVLIVTVDWIMLPVSSAVLLLSGGGAATLWARLPLFQLLVGQLYGLIVIALWYAPVYGLLLLVSAWARRAPFLWIVLPPLAISIFEHIAFHNHFFSFFVKERLIGFAARAFNFKMPDGSTIDPHFIPLTQLTPGKFLGSPGLWFGLVFAVACLAAAVRVRHYREPI
jgi:ABC-2 type transport system permease protein